MLLVHRLDGIVKDHQPVSEKSRSRNIGRNADDVDLGFRKDSEGIDLYLVRCVRDRCLNLNFSCSPCRVRLESKSC